MVWIDYNQKSFQEMDTAEKLDIWRNSAIAEEQEKAKRLRGKSLSDEYIIKAAIKLLGRIDPDQLDYESQEDYINLSNQLFPE